MSSNKSLKYLIRNRVLPSSIDFYAKDKRYFMRTTIRLMNTSITISWYTVPAHTLYIRQTKGFINFCMKSLLAAKKIKSMTMLVSTLSLEVEMIAALDNLRKII